MAKRRAQGGVTKLVPNGPPRPQPRPKRSPAQVRYDNRPIFQPDAQLDPTQVRNIRGGENRYRPPKPKNATQTRDKGIGLPGARYKKPPRRAVPPMARPAGTRKQS